MYVFIKYREIKVMSNKKKKKIKLNFILLILAVLSFCLYYTYNFYERLSISVIKTSVVDLGEIKKTINKDVVIIKKSIPVKSKRDGLLTKFYNQGDRVSKNSVIFKVQDSNSSDNDVSKLERINLQIDQMQNNSSYSYEFQSMQVDSEINYIYLDIQKRINNNDLGYLAKLKSELTAMNEKKKSISGDAGASTVTLQELYNQKSALEKKIATDNTYVHSEVAGDMSYYSDGYEDLFSYNNMMKISVKDIDKATDSVKKIDNASVKNGDVLGYIVDNHNYYIATSFDKLDVEAIKRDVALEIRIDDVNFNVYFYDFYKDADGKFVGLFKAESEDFDFLKIRKVNADIVYNSAKGMLIPNSAIVDVDGKRGVYVVDQVGIASFRSINDILLSDDQNSIVSFSYDDFMDKGKLKLYDEVVLSPKSIKNGQKVK